MKTFNVLVLCTHNSARSSLGEALFNHLGHGRIHAFSAGSQPSGEVDPLALATLAAHGVSWPATGIPRSKSWDEFAEPRPEYSLLHGLISLALNQPNDFINPLLSDEQSAEASYAQAIHDIEDSDYVDADVRPELYQIALDRLDNLLATGRLNPDSRSAVLRIREQLLAGLR